MMRTEKSYAHKRTPFVVAILLMTALALARGPASAQSQAEFKTLMSEMEALKKGQDLIQKDLAEIKKLLQRQPARARPQPFQPFDLSIEGAPYRGGPDAPVTMVEFTDYQCPFCGRYVANTLPQLVKDYVETGKLRYVIRELPIESNHPLAAKAAEAARCAGDQGKYWEMHDTLFKNQSRLKAEDLKAHAQALGLNAAMFSQCLESGSKAETVQADLKAGMKAGVRGTPTFFLGLTHSEDPGKVRATEVIRGAQPYSEFKQTIDQLLAKAKKGSEAGASGEKGTPAEVTGPEKGSSPRP